MLKKALQGTDSTWASGFASAKQARLNIQQWNASIFWQFCFASAKVLETWVEKYKKFDGVNFSSIEVSNDKGAYKRAREKPMIQTGMIFSPYVARKHWNTEADSGKFLAHAKSLIKSWLKMDHFF